MTYKAGDLVLAFFVLAGIFFANNTFAQWEGAALIQINQVGYYPDGLKIAIVTGRTESDSFYVSARENGEVVYRGKLTEEQLSKNSLTATRKADFSALKTSGEYTILVPGIGDSFPFAIEDGVYQRVAKGAIKSYYYNRSGQELTEQYAGKWARAEGHPDTTVYIHSSAVSPGRPEGFVISSPGGWYDAGDYNKYIVNSGITTGTLLSAYEDFTSHFNQLKIDIPENNNQLPDLLDEALYNIRWMLTMQDPADGGVYHKMTTAKFEGMVMPDKAVAKRYVVQKATPATLDFAAVMAQSARIFKPFEKELPGFSERCLESAEKAWQWAMKNPNILYKQWEMNKTFHPEITTGAYGDSNVEDEWFWSAAELYALTGKEEYAAIIKNNLSKEAGLPSWGDVRMLGYYTILRFPEKFSKIGEATGAAEKSVFTLADKYLKDRKENAFGVVMGGEVSDFVWGSNSVAANQGVLLLKTFAATGNREYLSAAISNMDYLLGRNATGYCFVTGYGFKRPMHPHHRISESDDIVEPIPGMLVGGPNPGRQDKCDYPFTETETSYVDSVCSYASNEIAINWNAPLVYLLNGIVALTQNGLKEMNHETYIFAGYTDFDVPDLFRTKNKIQ